MVIWRVGNSLYKLIVAVFLLLLIWAANPASIAMAESAPLEQDEFDTMSLPPEALIAPTILTGAMRDAKNPKLDSSMAAMAQAVQNSIAATAVVADSQSLRLSEGRVSSQITIHAPGLDDVVKTVTELGGEVTSVGYNDTLIQAWIPVDALETLAADENVYYIRRPAEAVLLDGPDTVDATTQGLAVINGPAWHSAGHTGSGVKVGIIDGGFIGYTGLLGTDLPSSVRVSNFVDGESDAQVNGTTPHGTAVAEIIHDIAPDAALYLAKVSTDLDLEQAVNWLKETHSVDVISTSIGWYNVTPGDGTGFFADLVAGARSADILWATAAGNERESHWGGGYVDSDSDNIHEFYGQEVNYFGPGDGDCYAIGAGNDLPVFLSWDDWDDVNQDYDLLLLRWNGGGWDIIAVGEDLQTGLPGQTPTEVAYSPSIGSATCYGFVIVRVNATRDVHFEVFAPTVPHFDEITHERSLVNLSDAPDAMTVAALDVTSPYPQESYSSEGPTNGPGGTATGGIVKPDIAAFANVATESYGGSTFNGTSSATPHVSGAAALVLSAYPSYSADQLQSLLEERAIDMGSSGMDTRFGHGRLYLGAPSDTPKDGPEISVSPTTLSVAQVGDSQTNRTLSISNSGDEALTWTIDESQTGEAGCASPTSISWLSVNPVSGSTPATSDSSVTVTFDSSGLTPNTYTGSLCIDSNDPDMPLVSITVQQIVQEPFNGSRSGCQHSQRRGSGEAGRQYRVHSHCGQPRSRSGERCQGNQRGACQRNLCSCALINLLCAFGRRGRL